MSVNCQISLCSTSCDGTVETDLKT